MNVDWWSFEKAVLEFMVTEEYFTLILMKFDNNGDMIQIHTMYAKPRTYNQTKNHSIVHQCHVCPHCGKDTVTYCI